MLRVPYEQGKKRKGEGKKEGKTKTPAYKSPLCLVWDTFFPYGPLFHPHTLPSLTPESEPRGKGGHGDPSPAEPTELQGQGLGVGTALNPNPPPATEAGGASPYSKVSQTVSRQQGCFINSRVFKNSEIEPQELVDVTILHFVLFSIA